MPTSEMDYFDQKPDLDLTPFFESKGIKLDKVPVSTAAPPPKGHGWVENSDNTEEEEKP